MPSHKLSGLQHEVLSLYKRLLRVSLAKERPASIAIYYNVRRAVRENASAISAKDHAAIEHLIRKGKKNVDLIRDPSVTSMSLHGDMEATAAKHGIGRTSHQAILQQLIKPQSDVADANGS
ncbi:hypothetical protein DFJ73DRAFT_32845 [Zopfochytrium polystomum]|nr:hypothetical protein DFJ73DRAFT_32845 [Zopfochytrium polystomum]